MLMAWRSTGLLGACQSRARLDAVWPASASSVRELLSAAVHAERLGELMQFRSISAVLGEQTGHIVVTMGLEEVEMVAAPLTRTGRLYRPPATKQHTNDIHAATSLLIEDLRARGVSLERAAG